MHEIDNVSYDAIYRYFNALSKFGYKSYGDVEKLIALLTLDEMLHVFNEYIDEDDFRAIINAIYCLSGTTCLIRYPEFVNHDSLTHKTKIGFTTRITEDDVIRDTQDYRLRIEV